MSDVRRLSRGQSHDFVTRLENFGLTPELAAKVIDDSGGTLAMTMVMVLTSTHSVDQVQSPKPPTFSMAAKRRTKFIKWHKALKLGKINIPQLQVTDEEYEAALAKNENYFFVHLTSLAQYAAFMTAIGQAKHWTLTHDDRLKINWDFAAQGYWIKTETAPICPRIKTSWNDLTSVQKIHLLSLEEYVIVWHFLKANGTMLDVSTWCWLRTRYNSSGALGTSEYDGGVYVDENDAEHLSVAYDYRGGRLAEVVN